MENLMFTGVSLDELVLRIEKLIDAKFGGMTKIDQPEIEYFSRREVCSLLKISLPTLHDWTKLGRVKSYKIGNRVLYKTVEIQEAVSNGLFQTHIKVKP
jgi:excisionase family DNA binding protein